MSQINSKSFLPPSKQEETLYQYLSFLADYVLNKQLADPSLTLNDIIEGLGIEYRDTSAVNSWFNTFVNPYVGTKSAIVYLLHLLGLEHDIVEWFQGKRLKETVSEAQTRLEKSPESYSKRANGLNPHKIRIVLNTERDIDVSRLQTVIDKIINERTQIYDIAYPLDAQLSDTSPIQGQSIKCVVTGGSGDIYYQWKREYIPVVGTDITLTSTHTGTTYQWRRNGERISGATSATYTPIAADANTHNSVSCLLTFPSPIAGTVITLTGGYSYQWQRSGVDLEGETSATYTPVTADTTAGEVLMCIVGRIETIVADGNVNTSTTTRTYLPTMITGNNDIGTLLLCEVQRYQTDGVIDVDVARAEILTTLVTFLVSAIENVSYAQGSNITPIQVSSSEGEPPYIYALAFSPFLSGISISPSTGVISGSIASGITPQIYRGTVTVTDSESTEVEVTFTLTVVIPLSITAINNFNNVRGTAITAIQVAPSGGTTPYAYSLTFNPALSGISISTSGEISGTVASNTTPGAYIGTVTVTDDSTGVQTATETFTVTVSIPPLAVTVPSDVTYERGETITNIQISASGGTSPYTYAATGLPSGLSINANTGVISGTVAVGATVQTYNVSVTVTDSSSPTAQDETVMFDIRVTPIMLSASAISDVSYIQGEGITNIQVSARNGLTPYSYVATGLPSGISINASTGVISGTVATGATAQVYNVVVTVTDSTSPTAQTVDISFAFTVRERFAVAPISTASYQRGATIIDVQVQASGGVTPYSYAIRSFPSGISIDANTGIISGTIDANAQPAQYTGVVTVTDSSPTPQNIDVRFIIIVTVVPLALAAIGDVSYEQGMTITNIQASASDGRSPYTYGATGLPNGITINTSTGVISGTVAADATAQTYNVSVSVTDSQNTVRTQTFDFVVTEAVQPLAIGDIADFTESLGQAIDNIQVNVTGGVSPYTYALAFSPALTGISISSSGLISGTVQNNAAAGDYVGTVTVTDSDSPAVMATETFTLTIPAFAVGSIGNVRYPVGATITDISVGGTGGLAPYTYTAADLPSGISIDATTGVISGTIASGATVQSYAASVTVTDSSSPTAQTATVPFVFEVVAAVAIGTSIADTELIRGTAFSQAIAVSGGIGPYTYALTSTPSTIAGLAASSTGIAGTVPNTQAVGTYRITYTVTDGTGATASVSFNLMLIAQIVAFTVDPRGTSSSYVEWPNPANTNAAITPNPTTFTYNSTAYEIDRVAMIKTGGELILEITSPAGVPPANAFDALYFDVYINSDGSVLENLSPTWRQLDFSDATEEALFSTNARRYTWNTSSWNLGPGRWRGGNTFPLRIVSR